MPGSLSTRTIELLDRHVFAEQLLLSHALERHQIMKCCTPTLMCRGAEVLYQSIEQIQRDTESLKDDHRSGRTRSSRKTPAKRSVPGEYPPLSPAPRP